MQKKRIIEKVKTAISFARYERASFGSLDSRNAERLPASEEEVTEFIKRRTELYHRTWIIAPLEEALRLLEKGP